MALGGPYSRGRIFGWATKRVHANSTNFTELVVVLAHACAALEHSSFEYPHSILHFSIYHELFLSRQSGVHDTPVPDPLKFSTPPSVALAASAKSSLDRPKPCVNTGLLPKSAPCILPILMSFIPSSLASMARKMPGLELFRLA